MFTYKNKYTKTILWRKIADKFDMSPEDAEKGQESRHSRRLSSFSAITVITSKLAEGFNRWYGQDC